MTPAEIYAIELENSEPKYYTMIPNVIDHLTYDDVDENGQPVIKRLSVYAKDLYRTLKMIAGEEGACWRNRNELAEICNMSEGMVNKCKKELCSSFHQLDGNPLIKIDKRKKKSQSYGTVYDVITIRDIWKWSNAYMKTLKFRKNLQKDPCDFVGSESEEIEARSQDDSAQPARACGASAQPARACGASAPQGARACGASNNNTMNKNPLFKEKQPASVAELSIAFLQKTKLLEDPQRKKALEWLLEMGCHQTTSLKIISDYSPLEIEKACTYTRKQMQRKKIDTPLAYFHAALKNKYYLKDLK